MVVDGYHRANNVYRNPALPKLEYIHPYSERTKYTGQETSRMEQLPSRH